MLLNQTGLTEQPGIGTNPPLSLQGQDKKP